MYWCYIDSRNHLNFQYIIKLDDGISQLDYYRKYHKEKGG